MAKHAANWSVKSFVTMPDGSKHTVIVFGRTREEARKMAREQHRATPHGVMVRTMVPVKFNII